MSDSVWTEIHDKKKDRIGKRAKGPFVLCKKCGEWCGHNINCEEVSVESIASLLVTARRNEEWARERAAKFFEDLQRLSGKIAILKHENNKLRKRLAASAGSREGN